MISLKLKDLVIMSEEGPILIPGIANMLRAKRVPIKPMYQLSKIGKRLVDEVHDFIEARTALVIGHGEPVMEEYLEGGETKERPTNRYNVTPEKTDAFLQKQKELLEVEIQIDLNPVKLSEMGEPEGVSAADFIACSPFIIEE